MSVALDIIRMVFALIGFYILIYMTAFLAAKGWYTGRPPQVINVNLGDGWKK